MSRGLLYLPAAELELISIYDLIAQDSPTAALNFVAEIRRRCEPLVDFPHMGRSLDGRLYRITFDRRVMVLYAFNDETLWIVGIRYLGRQWP